MRYMAALLVIEDMERSRKFYESFMGLRVTEDLGANVTFEDGFSLQTKETWTTFIHRDEAEILTKSNNAELYFEVDDLDEILDKLKSNPEVELVCEPEEAPWGQRSVHFYDPDKHILEVGENMVMVVKRFLKRGMTVEQVVERTGYQKDYVAKLQAEL